MGECTGCEMMGKVYRVSFGDDENVLKLNVVTAVQLFAYTRPLNCTL